MQENVANDNKLVHFQCEDKFLQFGHKFKQLVYLIAKFCIHRSLDLTVVGYDLNSSGPAQTEVAVHQ